LQQFMVSLSSLFVGEGWHLTLGLLFMLIVIFLPGGLMEGFNRVHALFNKPPGGGGSVKESETAAPAASPVKV